MIQYNLYHYINHKKSALKSYAQDFSIVSSTINNFNWNTGLLLWLKRTRVNVNKTEPKYTMNHIKPNRHHACMVLMVWLFALSDCSNDNAVGCGLKLTKINNSHVVNYSISWRNLSTIEQSTEIFFLAGTIQHCVKHIPCAL